MNKTKRASIVVLGKDFIGNESNFGKMGQVDDREHMAHGLCGGFIRVAINRDKLYR